MHTGDRQRRLIAVRGLPCDAVQQQRPARHSLRVPVRNREPREQRPPTQLYRDRAEAENIFDD